MVMQSDGRVLTVEEAKSLPPASGDVLAQRKRALDALRLIGEQAVERLGRHLTEDEFREIFGHPELDDDVVDQDPTSLADPPDGTNQG